MPKIKIRVVGPGASPPGWPGLAQPTSNFLAQGQPEPVFLQILARAKTLSFTHLIYVNQLHLFNLTHSLQTKLLRHLAFDETTTSLFLILLRLVLVQLLLMLKF